MQRKDYPEVPDDFGHWLAGFIDGEGCFTINRAGGGAKTVSYSCRLAILLRDDDRAILEEIVRVTGIGRVSQRPRIIEGSNPGLTWRVDSKADCFALMGLLDAHPLRAKKARDYAIWREAAIEWARFRRPGRGPARDWSRIVALDLALREGRVYQGSVLVPEPAEANAVASGDDVALF